MQKPKMVKKKMKNKKEMINKNKMIKRGIQMKIFSNVKIITRKDYNNLFRELEIEEVKEKVIVKRLTHFSALACPFPLTYYHTTDKIENNLSLMADYFQEV